MLKATPYWSCDLRESHTHEYLIFVFGSRLRSNLLCSRSVPQTPCYD